MQALDPAGGVRVPGLFRHADAEEGGAYDVSFWLRNEGSRVRVFIASERDKQDGRVRGVKSLSYSNLHDIDQTQRNSPRHPEL